jgi:secretion/DNA translocation related CpaE-like protein
VDFPAPDPSAPVAAEAALPDRPLVVTADPDALDELVRIASAAGCELEVAVDAAGARRSWHSAPVVVVGEDLVDGCTRARLARRSDVLVLGRDLDDAGIWQRAVRLGAEHVVFLPDAEQWLRDRLADAAEGGVPDGVLVAVMGGRGGAGATTFACALAVTAARSGRAALLVDADPLGGGIDLVFGSESDGGLRWPDLVSTRGRVPAAALAGALPQVQGLSVLSFDRARTGSLSVDALEAVLSAGRRSHQLVVVDLPRSLDDTTRSVLAVSRTTVLVVPTEVRATAAAACVAAAVGDLCADLRLVTRGPSPAGLTGAQVAGSLGLPLLAELRAEPGLDLALERGEPPAQRPKGPLRGACRRLVDELLPAQAVRRVA